MSNNEQLVEFSDLDQMILHHSRWQDLTRQGKDDDALAFWSSVKADYLNSGYSAEEFDQLSYEASQAMRRSDQQLDDYMERRSE